MIANYHTHTRWCRHATGEIEDYIQEAVRKGLRAVAITEHVPHSQNFDPRRMQWEEFPAYNAELDRLIEKYQDQIHVIKGFECEYYPFALENYKMFMEHYVDHNCSITVARAGQRVGRRGAVGLGPLGRCGGPFLPELRRQLLRSAAL